MSNTTIHLLWTSGWDSTYRLVELSRMDVTVQPVYITGMERPSEPKELAAQREILKSLDGHADVIATILPVKYIKAADLPHDERIAAAYAEIMKKVALGIQYETLAQCAALYPGIEIGSEGGLSQNLRMTEAINLHGKLIERDGVYVVDPENSDETAMLAFGNFTFSIIDKTERQMMESIREWDFEDVMSHIWFCHNPIDNVPCGICRACEVKMQSGLGFLLPKKAQRRHHFKMFLWKIGLRRYSNGICRRVYRRKQG
jgi:7-cyano-7-deazaguanine synthase